LTKSKKVKIIMSIIAISFIQGLQYSVSPVLSQIQEQYADVNVSLIQMLVTAPALLSMIVALVSGRLVAKISKKKMLVVAGLIAGVTGFLPYLANSFALLFISRTLYGVALGLACTLNTAVVAEFFEGDERVSVMGIQAASIGAGMMIITTSVGRLGLLGYQYSYVINIIGFISMLAIAFFLPDTTLEKSLETEEIKINKKVIFISFLGMIEVLFLITFTTNIAMHISGDLTGDAGVSGILIGVFSIAQIVMGLILGMLIKVTKNYTLPVAMLSFSIGGMLLVLYPSNYLILMIASVFCGFSQGMFVPQAMVEVSGAVKPVATAMAAACFTCALNLGQLVSPTILNTLSKVIFNEVNTSNVYKIASIGMTIAAVMVIISEASTKTVKQKKSEEVL